MNRSRSVIFGLAAVALLGVSVAAESADYWVALDGDDANPGTLEQPFRDPVLAAEKLMPGDTLHFRQGRYRCRTGAVIALAPARDGEPGRPIVFRNHADEHVVIDVAETDWGLTNNGFDWIVFDGFEVTGRGRNNMKISAHHGRAKKGPGRHVTVRNCEVHGARSANILAVNTPFLTIENCHLHSSERSHGLYVSQGCHNAVVRHVTSENNRGNSGMQFNAAIGGMTNALVEANMLRGNAHGFSLMGVSGSVFRNNILFNNGFDGPRGSGGREVILWTYDTGDTPGAVCERNLFENNTVVNLVPAGHRLRALVESKAGTRAIVFRNNVFFIPRRPAFALASFETFAFEHNALFNIDGSPHVLGGGTLADFARTQRLRETGTQVADPMFADMAGGDFRLRPNSPLKDAGAVLPDGTRPDIGARHAAPDRPIGCRLPWRPALD